MYNQKKNPGKLIDNPAPSPKKPQTEEGLKHTQERGKKSLTVSNILFKQKLETKPSSPENEVKVAVSIYLSLQHSPQIQLSHPLLS